MPEERFGSYLKALRLAQGLGLRAFAEKIGMFPSNLSDIEHGKKAPPKGPDKLAQMAAALGITRGSKEWSKLHDLSVKDTPEKLPPDLVAYAQKSEGIPFLLRTAAQKKLSRGDLERLVKTITEKF